MFPFFSQCQSWLAKTVANGCRLKKRRRWTAFCAPQAEKRRRWIAFCAPQAETPCAGVVGYDDEMRLPCLSRHDGDDDNNNDEEERFYSSSAEQPPEEDDHLER